MRPATFTGTLSGDGQSLAWSRTSSMLDGPMSFSAVLTREPR